MFANGVLCCVRLVWAARALCIACVGARLLVIWFLRQRLSPNNCLVFCLFGLLMVAALPCEFVLTTATSPNNCCCERVCRFFRSVREAWQRIAMLALYVAVVVVTLECVVVYDLQ